MNPPDQPNERCGDIKIVADENIPKDTFVMVDSNKKVVAVNGKKGGVSISDVYEHMKEQTRNDPDMKDSDGPIIDMGSNNLNMRSYTGGLSVDFGKKKDPSGKVKGLIIGAFDVFHEGHEKFILEARGYADQITALIIDDDMYLDTKKQIPWESASERAKKVREHADSSIMINKDNFSNIVDHIDPDFIILGYDQDYLKHNIKKLLSGNMSLKIEIVFVRAHEPEKFKSSIIKKKLLEENRKTYK